MLRKATLAALVGLVAVSGANAALIGSFTPVSSNVTTNALVYPGAFDTYAFQLQSNDLNYDALSLDFKSPSGSFLETGSTTFKTGASNPVVFGFEAPDTFVVLPTGGVQLAGTMTDTASELQSDFTTQGALTIVPNTNVKTTVAFFSVPHGTAFGNSIFVAGSGVSAGGNPVAITLAAVPEPATLGLLGLALAGCVSFIRRR